ncbi:hypothetical protein RJD40_16290 [Vibrio scophthalmi]|uniref:hypothetical protein n=1 Tax=Vibrio scophthalmi TaxID=45658 RepID=UPI003AAA2419
MSKLSKVFCEEFEEYLSVALFLALIVLCPEESPNDFDKNHKFKVDAHLVM